MSLYQRFTAIYLLLFLLLNQFQVLVESLDNYSSPETIILDSIDEPATALNYVASGSYHLLYYTMGFSSSELNKVDPQVFNNLLLIRIRTQYYDLVFNIVENVIDPNAKGEVILFDKKYPGKIIPGLVLYEPWILGLASREYPWVNITEIDFNDPYVVEKLHWNPMAIRGIRLAINYLLNRKYIVDYLLSGDGEIMYSPLDVYPLLSNLTSKIYRRFDFKPEGDIAKALSIYREALKQVNNTLQQYGMYIYFKRSMTSPNTKWLWFHKPNGSEEIVTLRFYIRVDDNRYLIGRYVSKLIEKYFGIKVIEYYVDQSFKFEIYSTDLLTAGWSIYTEGWVATGESMTRYAGYDLAFFYLPLSGNGVNSLYWVRRGWYWFNGSGYELASKLFYSEYGSYEELYTDLEKALTVGLRESIRVFIAVEYTYMALNKKLLLQVIPDKNSGLYTLIGLRSLKFKVANPEYYLVSSSYELFYTPWNIFYDMGDINTYLWYSLVTDPLVIPIASQDRFIPLHLRSYKVVKGPFNLSDIDGYIYDPVLEKWVHISNASKSFLESYYFLNTTDIGNVTAKYMIVLNYYSIDDHTLGKWHDGSNITLADIIYWIGFLYEWSFNDTLATGLPDDKYYYALIDYEGILSSIYGIKIINDTAIAMWIDYDDVNKEYLISNYDYVLWSPIPWHLLYSIENLFQSGKTTYYGERYWWSSEEGKKAIDFFNEDDAEELASLIEAMIRNKDLVIPNYLSRYPVKKLCSIPSLVKRLTLLVNFIHAHDHSYVSNGPYYVDAYYGTEMILKKFNHYIIDIDKILSSIKYTVIDVEYALAKTSSNYIRSDQGQSLTLRFKLKYHVKGSINRELVINASKLKILLKIYAEKKSLGYGNEWFTIMFPVKNITYRNGFYEVTIPSQWLNNLTYRIVAENCIYTLRTISNINSTHVNITIEYPISIVYAIIYADTGIVPVGVFKFNIISNYIIPYSIFNKSTTGSTTSIFLIPYTVENNRLHFMLILIVATIIIGVTIILISRRKY